MLIGSFFKINRETSRTGLHTYTTGFYVVYNTILILRLFLCFRTRHPIKMQITCDVRITRFRTIIFVLRHPHTTGPVKYNNYKVCYCRRGCRGLAGIQHVFFESWGVLAYITKCMGVHSTHVLIHDMLQWKYRPIARDTCAI
jgi:hypothetical protein